jgi:hypothetical protein
MFCQNPEWAQMAAADLRGPAISSMFVNINQDIALSQHPTD